MLKSFFALKDLIAATINQRAKEREDVLIAKATWKVMKAG